MAADVHPSPYHVSPNGNHGGGIARKAVPTRTLRHLGIIRDDNISHHAVFWVPQDKLEKLQALIGVALRDHTVLLATLQKIIGKYMRV